MLLGEYFYESRKLGSDRNFHKKLFAVCKMDELRP